MPDLMAHFGAYHPGPFYHGTKAELQPGDLIEPNKYPPSHDPEGGPPGTGKPREHTYFSPHRSYIEEYYGPHVYEVEPEGEFTHDPEYKNTRRRMFRSTGPLRVVRRVSTNWGEREALLAHFGAAEDEGFPNPYHGQLDGGNPEFSHTWFHGTKGVPDLSQGRPAEKRWSEHESWPQPNKMLGTHFSPLHSVAHGFAFPMHPFRRPGQEGYIPGEPSAVVHAKLHFKDPAHFPTEDHLNLAIARWADRESPHWHDAGLNKMLLGAYSDQLGTHQDWHAEPRDLKHLHHMGKQAEHVLSWHPHLPEILHGFTQHLIDEGHHGITYGNNVEGPYGHASAIATRPSQIETTRVEHIAAPEQEPEPHEVSYSRRGDINHPPDEEGAHGPASSDLNESEGFHEAIERLHTGQAKGDFTTYPRPVRLAPGYREHREAARTAALEVHDYKGTPGNNLHITRNEYGHIPTSVIANMPGARGEVPGEHRNMDDEDEWPEFKEDIARNGIRHPVFITVNHGEEPRLSEGNHRRDAALELGISHVPAEIRYFGHAEQQGTVLERAGHREAALTWPWRAEREEAAPDEEEEPAVDWSQGWPGERRRTRRERRADPHVYEASGGAGDRYVTCDEGHDHWGAYGAAGLLIRHRGQDGEQRYLLQKRSPWVQHGSTWSIPGGAIGRHESPEEGAWREAREEIGSIPKHVTHHHTITSTDHGNWKYHTVVADAGEHFMPRGGGETQDETEGVGWHTADEIEELREQGDLHPGFAESWDAVRRSRGPRTAMVTPGSLPPEQEAGFQAEDHKEYTRRLLDVAKNPPPGTRVWRGERRKLDEDPETAETAGMHWSVNPDSIITGWAHPDEKHVVWQGVIEHGEEQALPRSHPIWRGQHASFDHEAEVRMRPGARLRLEGAYVHTPKEYEGGMATTPGYLVPRHPERTHPDWKWHPLDRHITIKHSGHGASDYTDVGISREASWDSSGSEQTGLYVRFGHWPKNERSYSPAGGYDEDGVSVYDLDKHGNPSIDHGLDRGHLHDESCEPDCDLDRWDPDNDPRQEMQGRVAKAERNRYYGNDKPSETAHLVRGEMAAIGYDGEPLLHNVRRVGDWIDHRHLFFPGAERHRLARGPYDEGYEPPKGLPRRGRQAAKVPRDEGSRVPAAQVP